MHATSVISAHIQRPSPSDHRVGFSNSFTRLRVGSLALRPAILLFGNSRQRVTTMPLPHATEVYGQLPRRNFNPLDLLLLLRTVRPLPYTYASIEKTLGSARVGWAAKPNTFDYERGEMGSNTITPLPASSAAPPPSTPRAISARFIGCGKNFKPRFVQRKIEEYPRDPVHVQL